MAAFYRLTSSAAANAQPVVRVADSAFIQNDAANADYQTYLAWLGQGHTPDPFSPGPQPATAIAVASNAAQVLLNRSASRRAAGDIYGAIDLMLQAKELSQ